MCGHQESRKTPDIDGVAVVVEILAKRENTTMQPTKMVSPGLRRKRPFYYQQHRDIEMTNGMHSHRDISARWTKWDLRDWITEDSCGKTSEWISMEWVRVSHFPARDSITTKIADKVTEELREDRQIAWASGASKQFPRKGAQH